MSSRKEYDPGLVKIGELLVKKRKALGEAYKSRESFIERRSDEIFNGNTWISPRHLANYKCQLKNVQF